MSTPDRPFCYRCFRAESVCYCGEIRPFAPTFRTVLLQHPKERKRTIGTARLTHLSLSNSLLFAGVAFDDHPDVRALLDDPRNECVVLFPGPRSIDVGAVDAPLPFDPARTLAVFVIDGTWPQAKTILHRSPRLAALPQIRFTPSTPSAYRFRKQPREHCLSTIEAVHELVGALDPSAKADAKRLLETFARLVEQQIRHTEPSV